MKEFLFFLGIMVITGGCLSGLYFAIRAVVSRVGGNANPKQVSSILVGIIILFLLLVAIAIPSFVKARGCSTQNACINNLRIIDAAKEKYAITYHLSDGDTIVTASVNEYIVKSLPYSKGSRTPRCPEGGTYIYGNIGSNPQCSITTPTSHIFGGGRGSSPVFPVK